MGEIEERMCSRKGHTLGEKIGSGKDKHGEIILPKEKVILTRTLSFVGDHFVVCLEGGQGT
jgi:hypothetical protein